MNIMGDMDWTSLIVGPYENISMVYYAIFIKIIVMYVYYIVFS